MTFHIGQTPKKFMPTRSWLYNNWLLVRGLLAPVEPPACWIYHGERLLRFPSINEWPEKISALVEVALNDRAFLKSQCLRSFFTAKHHKAVACCPHRYTPMLFTLGREVNKVGCVYALLEIYRGHFRMPSKSLLPFSADPDLFMLFKSGYKLGLNLV